MSIGKKDKKLKPILFVILVLTVVLAMSSVSAADDDGATDAVIAETSDYDIEEVSVASQEVVADTTTEPLYSVDDATVTEEAEDISEDIDTNTNSDAADEASTDSGAKNTLASESGSENNLGVGEQDVGAINFDYPTLYGADVCDFTVTLGADDAGGTVTVTIIDPSTPDEDSPRTIVYVIPVVNGVAKANSEDATITIDDAPSSFEEVILAVNHGEWAEGQQLYPDSVTIAYSGDDTYAAKTLETFMNVLPFQAEMEIEGAKIGEEYDYGEALGLVNFEVNNPFDFNNPIVDGEYLVVIIPGTIDTDEFDPIEDIDEAVYNAKVHIVGGDGSLTVDNIFDAGQYWIGIYYDEVNYPRYVVWEGFEVVNSEVGPFVLSSNGIGYATLKQALEIAEEGDTITVIKAGTYKGTENTGLTVSKSVTIAAAGELDVYFDCESNNNFITVQSGKTVSLKDIVVQNGKAEKGGAVYVENGANLNVDGVNFVNNVANTRGGAIYSEGKVGVLNSIFYQNDITTRNANVDNGGAAIYNYGGMLYVMDCNFDENLLNYAPRTADGHGDLINGVVMSSGTTSIFSSRFYKNNGCYGAALTVLPVDGSTPSLVLQGTSFIQNDAYCGAAIQIEQVSDFSIYNCVFENNNVGGTGSPGYGPGGGALFITGCDGQNTISNTVFSGNKGPDGGAINVQRSTLTIDGCNFTANTGGYGAGVSTYIADVTIKGSNFINNTVTTGGAGVCLDGESVSKITDSVFTGNEAPKGAAIADYSEGTTTIDGCTISENEGTQYGAVYAKNEVASLNIKDSTFENNIAPDYRNIYTEVVPATLSGNTFDSNETTIKVNNISYGADEVINGTFDSGTNLDFNTPVATLTINGAETTATVPTQTTFTKTVEKPNAGNYTATLNKIADSDNNVILVDNVAGVYNVAKAAADVTVENIVVTYPEQATVVVKSNVSGTYTIRVGNKDYEVVVDESGEGSKQIDLLEPGVYDIDVSADFGPNYEPISHIPIATLTVNDQTGPFVVSSNGLGYATLAEALAVAEDSDTITVVEAGVYTGTGNIGVTIDKNIILTAGEGLDVVFDAKGDDTNILTIANGKAVVLYDLAFTGVDNTNTRYGAVVNHGKLTVTECAFYENNVNVPAASGSLGAAAIFSATDATGLTITSSTFIKNTATPTSDAHPSGGIAAVASWATSGEVLVKNSYFEENVARFGAALEFENLDQSTPCVEGCIFVKNNGYVGAAINFNDGCKVAVVNDCTFTENTLTGPQGAPTTGAMGGAICAGSYTSDISLIVTDCKFTGNKDGGDPGASGGAIRLANRASGWINNCEFTNNSGAYGSAISAGTINYDEATLIISGCNFTENVALKSGTVQATEGVTATIVDSIFSGNTAPENRNLDITGTVQAIARNTFDLNETTIIVNNIPYGEDEVINGTFDAGVNVDLTGAYITLNIDGVTATTTEINEGSYTKTYNKPSAGTHTVVFDSLTDEDNNKFIPLNTVEDSFIVYKAVADVTVTAEAVTYPTQATVVVTSNVSGTYNIRVGNKNYTVEVGEDGTGSTTIDVLDPGVYDIDISADFGDNYEPIVQIPAAQLTVNAPTGPFVVESTGYGYATLADALAATNGVSDVITVVEAGTYTGEGNINVTVDQMVTIRAKEGLQVIFDAEHSNRFLNVTNVVRLENVVVVNGEADHGGAIYVTKTGELIISNSSFANNHATASGGALFAEDYGKLGLIASNFTGNSADGINAYPSGGAVFVGDSQSFIDGCNFQSNQGGNSAGAVYMGADEFYIIYSNFTGNKALGGSAGALWVNGLRGEVSNCSFEENEARDFGGAIEWRTEDGELIDCNLHANKASQGGAIHWYGADGAVYGDSYFYENVATNNGGAIFWEGTGGDVETTLFDKNTAGAGAHGNAIYWVGADGAIDESAFSRNTGGESAIIWLGTGGEITDSYFYDDNTGNLAIFNIYKLASDLAIEENTFEVPTVTIHSDKAQYVYDETATISGEFYWGVNDCPIDFAMEAVKDTGVPTILTVEDLQTVPFTYEMKNLLPGQYVVSVVNFTEGKNNNVFIIKPTVKTSFVVNKADPTIEITGDEVLYGETGEVTIKTNVPGFYNVTVNGFSTIVNITDEATIEVPVMDAGKYDIVVFTGESENYNAATKTAAESYIVNKATPVVEITGCEVQYPDAGTVTIKTDVAGTYTIFVKGVEAEVVVTETTGQATFVTMAPGRYNINVTFQGNANYEAGEWIAEGAYIVTNGVPTIKINVPEVAYGEEAEGTVLLLDADGNPIAGEIQFTVADKAFTVTTNSSGEGTFEIPLLDAGLYEILAYYPGDETSASAIESASLTVNKAYSAVESLDVSIKYGEDAKISVLLSTAYEDLSGVVAVSLDGQPAIDLTVTDGTGSHTFEGLSVGTHTVILTYLGTDNIYGSQKIINIEVDKAFPRLSVKVDDIYYGDDAIVKLTLTGLDGEELTDLVLVNIYADVDDIVATVYVPVVGGVGVMPISGLDVGEYVAVANVTPSENYDEMFAFDTFEVFKTEIGYLAVSAEDIEFGEEAVANVEFYDVYGDGITGTVVVKVNGMDYTVNVENGQGSVSIPGIPAGKHNLVVVFEGDGRYGEAYNYSSYLTVNKNDDARVIIQAEDVPYGEPVVITVKVLGVNDAVLDGIVQVVIDNVAYNVAVLDGSGTLEVPGLAVGTYDIVAQFIGDDNYAPSAEAYDEVEVYEAKTVLIVGIENTIYGEDVIVRVTLLDENDRGVAGTVTLNVADTQITVTTNEDGEGRTTISGLAVNGYEWTAEYAGASGYAAAEDDGTFYVLPNDELVVVTTVNEPQYGEDAVITIVVTDFDGNTVDGDVTIEIDGRDPITVSVEDGHAEIPISDLPAGTTVADILFFNPNYLPVTDYAVITVSKNDKVKLVVTGDEVDFGEPATVTIKLTEEDGTPIVGTVLVTLDLTVDGIQAIVVTDENGEGEATFPVQLYGVYGTYDVIAKYIGDDNHAAVENTEADIVIGMPNKITFDLAIDEDNTVITVSNAINANDEPVSGYIMGELYKDGVKIADLTMGELDEGTGTIAIPDGLEPGNYKVEITVTDEDMELYGIDEIEFTIEPISGVQVTIDVADYTVLADDAYLNITVTDADGNSLNGYVNVFINGQAFEWLLDVIDGKASSKLEGFAPGDYVATVDFYNSSYLNAGNQAFFSVLKIVPTVTVTGDEIELGENATVTITVSDSGLGVPGLVVVTVNDVAYAVTTDDNGKGTLEIANLPAGEYAIAATFQEGDIFDTATYAGDAKVLVNIPEGFTYELAVDDNYASVAVFDAKDAAGNLLDGFVLSVLYKDGEKLENLDPVSLDDGAATIVLPEDLDAGTYTVKVSVIVDNYLVNKEIQFTIDPESGVQIIADVEDYPFTEEGNLAIDVTDAEGNPLSGNITIVLDSEPFDVIEINNGHVDFELGYIDIGKHDMEVIFTNPNYLDASYIVHFEVLKVDPVVKVTGTTVEYGEPATVKVEVSYGDFVIDGRVIVTVDWGVDGLTEVIDLVDGAGEATFQLSPYVAEGEYTITATYLGDDRFNEVVNNTEKVIVTPSTILDVSVTVNEPLTVGDDVIVTITAADASGQPVPVTAANVTVNGVTEEYPVREDGTINLGPFPAGHYEIEAIVDDGFHTPAGGDVTFDVAPTSGAVITTSVADYPFTEEGNLAVNVTDADDNPLSGNLTIVLDGEIFGVTEIIDGHLDYELGYIDIGKHNMEVMFINPDYLDASSIVHFEVLKVDPVVKVTGTTVEYGDPATVKVEVSYGDILAQGRVIVVVDWGVDGLTEVIELDEGAGEATFQLSPYVGDGEYTITATYLGDDRFNEVVNNTEKVIVTPSTVMEVSVTANQPTEGEDLILTVTAVDESGSDVPVTAANVTIDGVTQEYPVAEDGTINLGPLPAGSHEIEVIVDDGFHTPAGEDITVVVSEIPAKETVITVTATNITFGEVAVIDFTLKDIDGNDLDGILNVTVGDINKTVTVTGGKGSVTIPDLAGGVYPVVANFEGNKQYAASTGTGDFRVARKTTKFIYEDMETTTMDSTIDGRNGEYFCWTLVDADGNPVANKSVSIGFNGKVYNRTTNATGGAKLQINLARADIYTFGIAFLGDDDYNGTFEVAKITTTKTEPKLTVPNKSYKASASTKTLTATFKSTLGNPAEGRWITFTVNGKTYKAKTDANGVASVNVSLKTKGTYTVTAKFDGDNTFKATTKTATLKLT